MRTTLTLDLDVVRLIIPEVNLLHDATISGFSQHERSRAWLEDLSNGVGFGAPGGTRTHDL